MVPVRLTRCATRYDRRYAVRYGTPPPSVPSPPVQSKSNPSWSCKAFIVPVRVYLPVRRWNLIFFSLFNPPIHLFTANTASLTSLASFSCQRLASFYQSPRPPRTPAASDPHRDSGTANSRRPNPTDIFASTQRPTLALLITSVPLVKPKPLARCDYPALHLPPLLVRTCSAQHNLRPPTSMPVRL